MASLQEVESGAAAMEAYVHSIAGWQADFVPWGTYENGARMTVNMWDSYIREVVPADRVNGCGQMLYHEISAAGYGNRVTPAQCTAAARAVLIATGRLPVPI